MVEDRRPQERCPATGKIIHSTPDKARWARARIRKLPDEKDRWGKLSVYECGTCHGWHVGHWKPFGIGEIPKEFVARAANLARQLEEVSRLNSKVNDGHRRIVAELHALGHPVADISRLLGMKERAVESWLEQSGHRSTTARMDTVDKIAEWYHRGQVDKAGRPYIEHPRAVEKIVAHQSGSKAQRMAALLHDVLEDTEATMEELRKRCVPEEVLVLVDALTNRRGESYEDYIRRVASVPDAVLVKRADILHNTDPERLAALDEKTRTRLIKKYSMAVDILDTITKELS